MSRDRDESLRPRHAAVAGANSALHLAAMNVETLALRRAPLFGLLLGATYGLVARLAVAIQTNILGVLRDRAEQSEQQRRR